jgi:hypothetical protein
MRAVRYVGQGGVDELSVADFNRGSIARVNRRIQRRPADSAERP